MRIDKIYCILYSLAQYFTNDSHVSHLMQFFWTVLRGMLDSQLQFGDKGTEMMVESPRNMEQRFTQAKPDILVLSSFHNIDFL